MSFLLGPVAAAAEPTPDVNPRVVEALRLVESEDPYQREVGFLRLEALREPSTVELIEKYLQDPEPEMRAYAFRAIAAIGGPQSVPKLLQALKADRSALVRRAAILGLEPLQPSSPDVLPAFIKALRDRNTEVRIVAVDVVSRIDDPQARQAILTRNKRERRRDVRRVLELAMKRLHP